MPSPTLSADVLVRTTGGGRWERPATEGYLSEYELQEILGAQPSVIDGIENAVALREFSTGVGPADLVIVDGTGTITVVECKLARNQEIRRTIMGQVLDYASRLAEMTPEDFVSRWARQGGPSLDDFFATAPDGSRERFQANLRSGVFTLVLAVDAINDDLRRIVRYLNRHTTAGMRLLAIELRRVAHGDVEMLIPTAYGTESADEKNAQSASRRWTHADVDQWLRDHDAELAEALADFDAQLAAHGYYRGGGGTGAHPSYSVEGVTTDGQKIQPFSVYCGDVPLLSLNFQWLVLAGREVQRRFLTDLRDAGANVDVAAIESADFKKRPSVLLSLIVDPSRRTRIVDAAARALGRDSAVLAARTPPGP
ncbi:hypothetical protein [Geodermatophilus poikilotrophus]|uniref:DUF91 domain-containing protein n=1 Tax=Geodermatophilus poikilotrophus TaxID=1333667 RepID=A0A1I0CQQ2_9ACTN|nr:hypothetical protein [Geodermatophilus poikilotrophus]SET21985.1 hypothetical protein SAMN04488546_1716 [Geodermatophilus poikilotrophus]